jgi:Lon protease-like protein
MHDDSWVLEHFGGIARLFPLPNVVLFPRVVQPLHIFEARYREMTADALAGDRLIAPVLLRPGWEADYEGRPAVHSVLCLGRIVAEQRLPDGRFNLLLRGLSRARIIEEVTSPKLYRSARVELLGEGPSPPDPAARQFREQIGAAAARWFPPHGPVIEQLQQLLHNQELPLGTLCDLLGFAVPLPFEAKQALLEELDVIQRAQALAQFLQVGKPAPAPTGEPRKFPPDFSPN